MKKTLFSICISFIGLASAFAQPSDYLAKQLGREDVYSFRAAPSDINGRFNNPAPVFVIFPDTRMSKIDAERMMAETGLQKLIDDYSGSVHFMNPKAEKYDNVKDFEEYVNLMTKLRAPFNVKVVGIGNGATFVNETVARKAGNVAGIVSIGGKAPKKVAADESPVPAYIVGKNASKIASGYIKRDNAVLDYKDAKKSLYVNPEESLLRVYVDEVENNDFAAVLADAWDKVLSWNYRFNNTGHTWYNGESFLQYGDGELEPFIMFDRLGLTRNVCVKNLAGTGDYLWYEYLPESFNDAPEGSVPLVVLLHGNNNDPRTQAETSGFLPLASGEGFMVAEFEWQGNGYAVMGHDGIETTIYELFRKYPQIDRSRVYAEGLSAGAFNASALGIKKTHIFAAVGAQSGGVMPTLMFGSSMGTLFDEVILKSEGCDMPYFSISGAADDVVRFVSPEQKGMNSIHLAWQAYQIMNDLPRYETLDFNVDKDFGMKMENRTTENTVKNIAYEIGDQCKGDIPLIRIVSVQNYGHWNFQPGAELMWNYFKMFSRDTKTKKLVYHGK